MNSEKITKIVSAILGILGVVFLFLVLGKSADEIKSAASMGDFSSVSPIVNLTFAVLFITVSVTLIFSLLGLFSNKEKLKKALISIGFLILVVGISYLFSSGEETPLKDGEILSAQGSRLVETGIRTVYILGSIAILLMVFSTIRKSISK